MGKKIFLLKQNTLNSILTCIGYGFIHVLKQVKFS